MALRTVTDQMGRRVDLSFPPRRIISLVPSQTELLATLGLDEEVVGITKFCVHPESWYRSKARIGGTKQLHMDRIADLKPDLIIGNKEENDREQIEALMRDFPVWMSDISTFDDATHMIAEIGAVCDRKQEARKLCTDIRTAFRNIPQFPPLRSVYLIWNEPIMAVGPDTFIHDMLIRTGLKNLIREPRYPELTETTLQRLAPEVILLSSEPFPFREKHVARFRKLCPEAVIMKVDGELFSWYGSRLLKVPKYLHLLRKKLIP